MAPPDCVTGVNALQLASGAGVSPCRAKNAALVPAGISTFHDSPPQSAACVASNTREVNVPAAAYGLMRIQSTEMLPAPAEKSLASGRIGAAIESAWVATTLPSTEYTTLVASQSMRKRCGPPSSETASGVSMLAPPVLVRAKSPPPLNVLNTAHGAASNVSAKPTCWNALPLNVAMNSTE